MKRVFISVAFMIATVYSSACEICGCSSGSYFIGPYPHFNQHFVGLRFSERDYFSRISDDPGEFSHDSYSSIEAVGSFSLGKRWQLLAFVPFNINKQQSDEGNRSESGLGDITILANLSLHQGTNHQYWIGAGMKIPTGKFQPGASGDAVPEANLKPGTGSLDFILNAGNILHIQQWSLNGNINMKINSEKKEFHFGNRLNVSEIVALNIPFGKNTLTPFAGIQYEHLSANRLENTAIEETGGRALLGTAGLSFAIKKFRIAVNMQAPVAQNFSNDQTRNRWRGMLELGFRF